MKFYVKFFFIKVLQFVEYTDLSVPASLINPLFSGHSGFYCVLMYFYALYFRALAVHNPSICYLILLHVCLKKVGKSVIQLLLLGGADFIHFMLSFA